MKWGCGCCTLGLRKGVCFLIIYIIHVGKGCAVRVPDFFQMAPPQLALHRAGGPNKGMWLAPWVRFPARWGGAGTLGQGGYLWVLLTPN
jgi:hypothetical protein